MKSLQFVKSEISALGGGAMDFAKDSAKNFAKDSAKDFAKHSAKNFEKYFAKDSAKKFKKNSARDFTKDFTKDSPKDFTNNFARIRTNALQIRASAFRRIQPICAFMLVVGFANAIELSSVCSGNTCNVSGQIPEVTNNGSFGGTINANGATITNVFNYGTISGTVSLTNSNISNFYNYGIVSGKTSLDAGSSVANFYNYGYLSGVEAKHNGTPKQINVSNYGVIGATRHDDGTTSHFQSSHIVITVYSLVINEGVGSFSTFNGNGGDRNSHITFSNLYATTNTSARISFKDGNSKIILDFGSNFELGKEYPLNKLIVGVGSGVAAAPNVDFSRLTTRSSLYTLTQGANGGFVIGLDTANSEMGTLYRTNLRAMNNMFIASNQMIWQRKRQKGSARVTRNIRRSQSSVLESPSYADAVEFGGESMAYMGESMGESGGESNYKYLTLGESLGESNGTFFYNSDSMLLAASQAQIRQYRNQNLGMRRNTSTRSSTATTRANQNDTFYFMIAPYVNYNYYSQSGQHNLQGLEYGGVAAFSGKIAGVNTLGVHFGFSYGKLSDKNDTDFDFTNMNFVANSSDKSFAIVNMNFLAGVHYKLDLIWDMYLKARGDFYYLMNQVTSFTTINSLKPNNMGFGVSLAYGKDFDFGSGGVLGLELGFDYMGLNTSKITLGNNGNANINETYDSHLYNLIYADFGMSYDKYFGGDGGGFGVNLGLGIRGNVTANKLAKSQILLNNTNAVDMTIDNDNFLGYGNVGIGYLLKARTFNMEFSLSYYGSFGDKGMSNGGGIEWRTSW